MYKPKETKIGIIGSGNMGRAIAKRISSKYQLFIFDKDTAKTKNIAKAKVAKSVSDLIGSVDVVILAVKPQDFDAVLNETKDCINGKLIISIAAGISSEYVERALRKARVIRVMPNLPAKIGLGLSCLSKGRLASAADLNFAKKLFSLLGGTLILKEDMMNAATAVSGSGPGFLYALLGAIKKKNWNEYTKNVFIPRMSDCAKTIGFSKQKAKLLAKLTGKGSLALLRESNKPPQDLCSQVVSRGGTTEAGLKELKGDIKFLEIGVKAALKRAKELLKR